MRAHVEGVRVTRWAGAALLSSPQLVIVRNESPHTIVAYAISFKSTRPDGTWDWHHIEFKYPDAVVTTDPDIVFMLRDRDPPLRTAPGVAVLRYRPGQPG